jgi:hypothetical protein
VCRTVEVVWASLLTSAGSTGGRGQRVSICCHPGCGLE